MTKFEKIKHLQEPVEIPEIVQQKVQDAYAKIRMESRDQPEVKTEKRHLKKRTMFAAVALAAALCTAVAAGVTQWNRGLSEGLQVSKEAEEKSFENGLATFPQLSETKQGVTVTLDQCIVDSYSAYIALKVSGYKPPEGKQPGFQTWKVEGLGDEFVGGMYASFYDGLIVGADGKAVFADGTPLTPENETSHYVNADGDLEFVTSIVPGGGYDQALQGKEIHLTLGGLGVYGGKAEDVEVDVDETWDFTWTLTGTEDIWEKEDLNIPLWDSGAVLTYVRFSPIFAKIDMDFPKEEIEIEAAEDSYGNPVTAHEFKEAPWPYALKMKDGTVYYYIFNGGSAGYSGEEDIYAYEYQLDRIIDPQQVKSILFIKEHPEGEGTVPEEYLFEAEIQ